MTNGAVKLHRIIDGDITKCRLNKTLHGRSQHRKADVPGHNVVKGYSTPGKGDGLDVFMSKAAPAPAGAPVYATHAGQVIEQRATDGLLSCLYLEGTQNGHEVTTVYAHIKYKPDIKEGVHLAFGECIGWIDKKLRDPHVHIEIFVDGMALSAKTPLGLAKLIAGYTV